MNNKTKTRKPTRRSNLAVTVETRRGIVCLNPYASESLGIYIELLVGVCARRKLDARDVLINTDEYPELARSREVEFAIGWIHGVAEAHELVAEQLFDAVTAQAIDPEVVAIKKAWGIGGKRRPKQKIAPAKRKAA